MDFNSETITRKNIGEFLENISFEVQVKCKIELGKFSLTLKRGKTLIAKLEIIENFLSIPYVCDKGTKSFLLESWKNTSERIIETPDVYGL